MKTNNIANSLLKNYIVMLLITTALTVVVFTLTMSINTLNDSENIYNQMSASNLMQDDYTKIDTSYLVEYGGGLEVVDNQFNILYSKGKRQFEGISIKPGDFTNFLLEAPNNPDIITVEYNENEGFWLIISMPINVKMVLRLNINTQNPLDTSTLGLLGAIGASYLVIVLISTLIYSRRTAVLFIRPLHELCLAVEDFRRGNYSIRVAIEGNREFKELGRTFNGMAEEVQMQIALQEKGEENRKNLIRDISHDLKNPLMSIAGYAELNLKEEQTNAYTKIIYENSLRANELVQDLFELSQLESADFKLEYKKCDFIEYFREEIIRMLPELEKEGFEINIQIPEEEVDLWIDPKRIRRVISNLLYNVMTYHDDRKQLDIILENRDDEVCIVFSNSTDKIFTYQNDIFEPFVTREDRETTNINNVGLGLAIVKKIIMMHGGSVVLNESKDNRFEIEVILKKGCKSKNSKCALV